MQEVHPAEPNRRRLISLREDGARRMSLKRAALEVMAREQLAWYVEEFGVRADRRSREAMLNALVHDGEITAAAVLEPMYEADLKRVCHAVGLSPTGRRKALLERLLACSPIEERKGSREEGSASATAAPIFVALDFETADYGRDSACAVALVRVEGDSITRRAARLIRPPRRYFEFTYIHGITWSQVKDEPSFGEVWPELSPLLDGASMLVAHNASFDRRVLETCCEAARLEAPALPFECTMKLARKVWSLRPTRLPDVCRHLGIPLNHHDAASDAEACAHIVLAAGGPQKFREKSRR